MKKLNLTGFEVHVSAAAILDLRERLSKTRWTDQLPEADWEYGVELGYLRKLCNYWQTGYDFQSYQQRLNAFPQFLTDVDGEQIQFYHAKSKVPGARPLVLVHGWPGSVFEFLHLIPRLIDPQAEGGDPTDAFHVIVPSLPGYGYSGPTKSQNVDISFAARMVHNVMSSLGYGRYFAQGGDWGAITTSHMAELFPDHVAALHLNMAPGGPVSPFEPVAGLSEEEARERAIFAGFMQGDAGYSFLQSTRPQTLAVGLNDSPAGLAVWIADKFHAWTDHGGDLNSAFSFDQILDDITLYWLTGTANSSFRLYKETTGRGTYQHAKVSVPTGVTRFAGDPFRWPRSLVEQTYLNVTSWEELEKGCHFAAYQRPDDFLRVIRRFFRDQQL